MRISDWSSDVCSSDLTLHTVLAEPSEAQRRVIERLVARASRLVVMSDFGRQTLIAVYGAEPAKLVLIEHGTPDRPFTTSPPLRAALGIVDRPVLSTFGLLGRSEEHTSELQSLMRTSYAVFCLKTKKHQN